MTDDAARHWDDVYSAKAVDETSWYQPRAETSIRLLSEAVTSTGAGLGSAVDVGAGTSTLVDELLVNGWSPVTVLDVSAAALAQTRARFGGGADVRFVVTDVLAWRPADTFDAWHDRAVFHFLTRREHQARYVETAARAVRPGGVLIVGTFGPDGPEHCSGLPVARHDAVSLGRIFESGFDVLASEVEVHRTPWDAEQQFTWATLLRSESGELID
jgi:SAM-dependent methyltransferase